MRYTLLLLLIIAALHSGCQSPTAQRDKAIADSVSSYINRVVPHAIIDTLVILKIEHTTQKIVLAERLASLNNFENGTRYEMQEYLDKIKTFEGDLKDHEAYLKEGEENNNKRVIEREQKLIAGDSDSISNVKMSEAFQKLEKRLASIKLKQDSLARLIPTTDSVHNDYYVVLSHLCIRDYDNFLEYEYLDKNYSVICSKPAQK